MTDIFIDSGAPTLYNTLVRRNKKSGQMGATIEERKYDDFSFIETAQYKEYRQNYCDYLIKHKSKFSIYANLDIINNAEATWDNQMWFESKGLDPIPVFHFGSDIKWLERYIKADYKYIAIGGLIPNSFSVLQEPLDKLWLNYLTDDKGFPIIKVHGFAVTSPRLVHRYPWYCMTEENHEVLTKEGWKYRSQLSIGEKILAFDKGKSIWEPILNIPTFPVVNEKITNMENRNFEAHISDNHKWITCNQSKKGSGWKFKTTEDLLKGDCIPRVGKYAFPTEKIYTNEQVELLGWFWTDGTINRRKKKGYKKDSIRIYQSDYANPEKCKLIEDALNRSQEKYCKTGPSISGMCDYELYGDVAEFLLSIAPEKKLHLDFILRLTKKQMELFLDTSILADGCKTKLIRKKGINITVTKRVKKENLEILRIGYLLLGIPTSIYFSNNGAKGLNTSSVDYIYNGKINHYIEKYTGNLWCVQVPSKAFFTRCGNKIYVTGNSVDSTSWVKFGMYGSIVVPKQKYGKADYKSAPTVVFVSVRSPQKDEIGKHINTLSQYERKTVERYIDSKGYILGKSEVTKEDIGFKCLDDETIIKKEKDHIIVERVLIKGVSNDNVMRDTINAIYYQDLGNSVPEWPWALKIKKGGFF